MRYKDWGWDWANEDWGMRIQSMMNGEWERKWVFKEWGMRKQNKLTKNEFLWNKKKRWEIRNKEWDVMNE